MFSRTGVSVNERLHYSVVIEWSDEDQVYIASLPEWGLWFMPTELATTRRSNGARS
jgi:hypothetical protein